MRRTTPFDLAAGDDANIRLRVEWDTTHKARGVLQRGTQSKLFGVFGDQPPDIALGAEVVITLVGAERRDEVQIQATTQARSDRDGLRSYTFHMDEQRSARALVARFIEATSNRRQSYRAQPPLREDITVLFGEESAGGVRRQTEAQLVDLSTHGCALQVSAETDQRFADVTRVRVALPLTAGDPPLDVVADIRHRRLARGNVRYGLMFDLGETPYIRAVQEKIGRRVVRWQLEQLKAVHESIDFM